MPRLKMGVSVGPLRLAEPFRISGHVFDSRNAVVVTLDDGAVRRVDPTWVRTATDRYRPIADMLLSAMIGSRISSLL
jgi:hypothetical protein